MPDIVLLCNTSSKALGYGTHDGRYMTAYTRGVYVDISTANGEILSKSAQPQISPIPELPMDLSQVVTRNNKQVQTVGHHWPLSGPLTKEMRDRIEQVGVCITCHKDIPVVGFSLVHEKSFHSQVMGRLLRVGQSFHNFSNQSDTLPR